jgi:branched-chain amino acid transport system ATP-binding protein
VTELLTPSGATAGSPAVDGNGFLRVVDVTVRFGGLTALDGVTFDVERGTIHAVIGPNGAGKSTLFNVLNGFYRATSGKVTLEDVELTGKRPHDVARLGIGRTFQHPGLFKGMGVMENLMIGRHVAMRSGFVAAGLRLPRSRSEERTSRRRVSELAELMQVTHVLPRRADEIAYGEQKRVELVRALALEPKVLLLDEPVAGMNAAETQQMGSIIQRVRDEFKVTIVLVEHDMGMVMSLAERITVLDFGRVIAEGNPAEVQANPEVKRAYLGF